MLKDNKKHIFHIFALNLSVGLFIVNLILFWHKLVRDVFIYPSFIIALSLIIIYLFFLNYYKLKIKCRINSILKYYLLFIIFILTLININIIDKLFFNINIKNLLNFLLVLIGFSLFYINNNVKSNINKNIYQKTIKNNIFYFIKKNYIYIILVIIFGFYIKHIEYIKFIDTDEVRLFYSASLILEGLVPFRDFAARSPFIIYFLSIFIYIFGASIKSFYILSALLVTSILFLSYLLIKRIYNEKIALINVFVLAFAPIIINLLYVKTQTFSIFLMLISALMFDNFLVKNKKKYLFLSYIFILFSLYSRISTISYFIIHIFLLFKRKSFRIKYIIYITIFSLFIILSFIILNTNLIDENKSSVTGISNFTNLSLQISDADINRISHIPMYLSEGYIPMIILGFIFTIFIMKLRTKNSFLYAMPILSILALGSIYIYNLFRHGFWPQYLMEFAIFYSFLISLSLYHICKNYHNKISKLVYIILTVIFIASSHINSYLYMKNYMNWIHKDSTEYVSQIINSNSKQNDTIFGSTPIYSFLSGRKQFMNLTHSFYSDNSINKISQEIIKNPPKYIIVDLRMRNTFMMNQNFNNVLKEKYDIFFIKSGKDYGKEHIIKIYKLII